MERHLQPRTQGIPDFSWALQLRHRVPFGCTQMGLGSLGSLLGLKSTAMKPRSDQRCLGPTSAHLHLSLSPFSCCLGRWLLNSLVICGDLWKIRKW